MRLAAVIAFLAGLLLPDLPIMWQTGAEVLPGIQQNPLGAGGFAGLPMCLDEFPIDVPGFLLRHLAELVHEIARPNG